MDKTGVLLSILKEFKVLVSAMEMRQYHGAGKKSTLITYKGSYSNNSGSKVPED